MTTLLEFAKHTGNRAWLVGGCVRDEILGRKPKDIDVVVTCSLEELETTLNALGVSYDAVGKAFGVLKARFSDVGVVDIALPRKERSTGIGHKEFAVEFGSDVSLKDDAARRDFTFNALSKNIVTGEIFDPMKGAEDLKAGLLRNTSENSFSDDPLRMLRAVQFVARFNLCVHLDTLNGIVKNAKLIDSVSAERIAVELEKLMLSEKSSVGLELMAKTGLLARVIPELEALRKLEQPDKFHNADAFDHTVRVVDAVRPDLNMRFAALFHDLGKATTKGFEGGRITFHGHEGESVRLANQVIDRLKLFSLEGFDRDQICVLVGNHMFSMNDKETTPAIRRLVRKVGGIERFHDLMQLRVADKIGGANPHTIWKHLEFLKRVIAVASATPAPSVKDLAVDGNDVMTALGIKPGPKVGEILRKLFDMVEEDLVENEKVVLLEKICIMFIGEN